MVVMWKKREFWSPHFSHWTLDFWAQYSSSWFQISLSWLRSSDIACVVWSHQGPFKRDWILSSILLMTLELFLNSFLPQVHRSLPRSDKLLAKLEIEKFSGEPVHLFLMKSLKSGWESHFRSNLNRKGAILSFESLQISRGQWSDPIAWGPCNVH